MLRHAFPWDATHAYPREQARSYGQGGIQVCRVGIRELHGMGEVEGSQAVSEGIARICCFHPADFVYLTFFSSISPPSTCPAEYIRDDEPDPSDEQLWDALYSHAEPLKALAKSLGLTLLIFQPLSQFEGWPKGSHRAEWVRRKAERWLPLCAKLGVGYLQVSLDATCLWENWLIAVESSEAMMNRPRRRTLTSSSKI